ncbi:MAG TPA: nuclear transport factor 2 family protein, partial [Gemmatimonadaceae bacterium]|nr:nuclear transport factor 2 family protein [Gemmatimonadaceae bacterium]
FARMLYSGAARCASRSNGSVALRIGLPAESKMKYTDYLSLLKLEGGWEIVNKIYVAEPIKH